MTTPETARTDELPLPPPEMRKLVGDPPPSAFSNPDGEPIFPDLPAEAHDRFLDFGCGCGRTARRLLQMHRRPSRFLGIDISHEMIAWCNENLAPLAEGFEFEHHPVYNPLLNPDPTAPAVQPLPAADGEFTLIEAISVFTHLVEPQAEHYLDEVRRVLADDGYFVATFFLFDRAGFPVLQEFQHALYVNEVDPTNAVYYDREWLAEGLARRGLVIAGIEPPKMLGYHWTITMTPARPGIEALALPDDPPPGDPDPPPARVPSRAERLEHYDRLREPARELIDAKRYIADLESHLARKDRELRAAYGELELREKPG